MFLSDKRNKVVALCAAPFIGVLADRFSRVGVTLGVSLVGTLGYLLLGLLDDPSTWSVQLIAAVAFLGLNVFPLFFWRFFSYGGGVSGIGEMGMLIMSQSILGLHAPVATRGSVSGFWAMCGSFGIMFGSGVGGVL